MTRTFIPRLHPVEDVFENYAFNRLSGKETEDFEEHLLICERCQETLEQTDVYVRLMKTATAAYAGQAGVCDQEPRRSASAATLLLLSCLTALLSAANSGRRESH
jgi:putative zinc finger protein